MKDFRWSELYVEEACHTDAAEIPGGVIIRTTTFGLLENSDALATSMVMVPGVRIVKRGNKNQLEPMEGYVT